MTPSRAQDTLARVAASTERGLAAGLLAYVGLDPSLTNTGIAHASPSPDITGAFTLHMQSVKTPPMEDVDERLRLIMTQVHAALPKYRPVFIEGLAFSRNDPSTQERSGLHYMIRAMLRVQEHAFIVVGPTTLKKFICGTGAAKKELMLKEMFRRYGVDTDDNNQADAAALAIFGLAHDGHIPMTQAQTDQMRSFKLPKVKKEKKRRAA